MVKETERRPTVGILEDDMQWAETLKDAINETKRFEVVFVTASSTDARIRIKSHQPDFFIVDLQMIEEGSEGCGLELLYQLNEEKDTLVIYPTIIVQTSNQSRKTQRMINSGIADFMFSKEVFKYNPKVIIAYMIRAIPVLHRNQLALPPKVTPHDKEELIRESVTSEINQYFMKRTNSGYSPLIDAICEVVSLPEGHKPKFTDIYAKVGKKYGMTGNNVNVAMFRVIESAFNKTAGSDLERLYEPYLDIGGAAPRSSEFIAYVANKIKKTLNNH